MIGVEQMKRDAAHRQERRLRKLRSVRKRTIYRAFMEGASVWLLCQKYTYLLPADIENAIRVCVIADAGEP